MSKNLEIVAIQGVDGETIYVSRGEASELGYQGILAKYSSVCIQREQKE